MAKLCGFNCLRWALILLNIFYITLGLILIGLAIASKTLSYFTEPHILIGIAICGTVLVLLAVFGLIGAIRHNQVFLFFYMVLLGISLLVMFAVSVAALVTPHSTQENVLLASWSVLSDNDKQIIQSTFNCCGFNNQTRNTHDNTSNDYHPPCNVIPLTNSDMCCSNSSFNTRKDVMPCPNCDPCLERWRDAIHYAVRLSGGFGLVFSFTQIIGIILTMKYRNEKDPAVDFNAVL